MIRAAIGAGVVVGIAVGAFLLHRAGYNAGQADERAAQEVANRNAYAEILRRINDDTLDADDDAAILAELCRLAGAEPDSPECSGL